MSLCNDIADHVVVLRPSSSHYHPGKAFTCNGDGAVDSSAYSAAVFFRPIALAVGSLNSLHRVKNNPGLSSGLFGFSSAWDYISWRSGYLGDSRHERTSDLHDHRAAGDAGGRDWRRLFLDAYEPILSALAYDPATDSLYIKLRPMDSVENRIIGDDIVIDIGIDGEPTGYDIQHASRHADVIAEALDFLHRRHAA